MARIGVERTGQRFGSIVVTGRAEIPSHVANKKSWWWEYRCDCGYVGTSCGRDLLEKISCPPCALKRKGKAASTHGMRGTSIYVVWQNMWQRCTNPNHKSFRRYGGRGIGVTPAWRSFEQFYADIPPKPEGRYQLDRIDNEQGYEPRNVRWATPRRNGRNRANNKLITWQGKTQCIADWADEIGISYIVLKARFGKGWDIDRALTTPWLQRSKRGTFRKTSAA